MLRISRLIRDASKDHGGAAKGRGHVVIWNLTSRCNLSCHHCYARASAGSDELTPDEARKVIDDIARQHVFVLILSGGEPLLREDLCELITYARAQGIFCALSTNGTLLGEKQIRSLQESGIGYVGISIDGTRQTHDRFRGKAGAYEASLKAIRLCRQAGIKVGLRFSLTSPTASGLRAAFEVVENEDLSKIYISHLNYVDKDMKRWAPKPAKTREVMRFVLAKAVEYADHKDRFREIVTGNNTADGPYLFLTIKRERPSLAPRVHDLLVKQQIDAWRSRLLNIDVRGDVHPDPFCRNVSFGNVRSTPLRDILLASKDYRFGASQEGCRSLSGRCGRCGFLDLCRGNSRPRAFAESDNWWGSDPQCYLTPEETATN
jgi:radical SAM protein with 4Fe4S-binding SPASM domain